VGICTIVAYLVDTNVLVAALLRSSSCRAILEGVRDGAFALVTSDGLLSECAEVSARPKFAGRIAPEDRRALLELLHRDGEVVAPRSSSVAVRDAKDRLVLNCAYAADVLVTGDHNLQVLKRVETATIMSPTAFLAKLTHH